MDLKTLERQQEILLEILSCGFENKKYTFSDSSDVASVFKESRLQSVSLQAYNAVNGVELDEWERYSTALYLNNCKVHSHHAYLHKTMNENGIDYCVLKGCASAFYYPDAALRAMGDVDFLVRAEDMDKAAAILLKEGFKEVPQDHICHRIFKKDKMHFEMHFEPAGMPSGTARTLIEEQLKDIFENSKTCEINTFAFNKPSHFHHALVMLMHMYHHISAEGIGLRHLCDWAAFIKNVGSGVITNEIEPRLKAVGIWHFAQIMSQVAHFYLGAEYETWMGEADRPLCSQVIADIFAGGNFGIKDEGRAMQGNAISNRGKDGYNAPAFIQFFRSLNTAAVTQFPILKRKKILRPFGFIALGTRRVFRVFKGTRSMPKMKGTFTAATQRKEIYKKFHLFETEEKQ